jgi:DNA processing protein
MDEREARIALSLVPGVGGAVLQALVEHCGSARAALRASRARLVRIPGVGPVIAQALAGFRPGEALAAELDRLREVGAALLVSGDPGYPALLGHIPSPPPVLYLRGALTEADGMAVAVVGSRRASPYGVGTAERLSGELAARGVTIVSGLARGIDAAAHAGALRAGGRTVAVLGCGIDRVYPPEHRGLAARIAAAGAVVSEFPLGTPPHRANFPRRNRLISGLSLGVVVVEAAAGSGALITARWALEQGREVFAVPGRVSAETSRGTHRLLREGAKLVEDWTDILPEVLPQARGPAAGAPSPPPPRLAEDEATLFGLVGEDPVHIDELILRSGLGPGRVATGLLGLAMRGLLRELPGKRYLRGEGRR